MEKNLQNTAFILDTQRKIVPEEVMTGKKLNKNSGSLPMPSKDHLPMHNRKKLSSAKLCHDGHAAHWG